MRSDRYSEVALFQELIEPAKIPAVDYLKLFNLIIILIKLGYYQILRKTIRESDSLILWEMIYTCYLIILVVTRKINQETNSIPTHKKDKVKYLMVMALLMSDVCCDSLEMTFLL